MAVHRSAEVSSNPLVSWLVRAGLIVLAALCVALVGGAGRAAAAAECQFVLGFQSLHGMIPDTVGACVERGIPLFGVCLGLQGIAEYFGAVATGRDGKQAANWVTGTLFGALNRAGIGIEQSPVSAAALGALIDRVADGTVSNRAAKDVFEAMVSSGKDADTVIEEQGLRQVSDTGAIEALVDQVIAENPDKVADYRGGKTKLMGWFVGQVMKASGGKANPKAVNETLRAKLDG